MVVSRYQIANNPLLSMIKPIDSNKGWASTADFYGFSNLGNIRSSRFQVRPSKFLFVTNETSKNKPTVQGRQHNYGSSSLPPHN